MATPNVKRCKDMYKMLYYLMELYEETPEELQPYLMSFIKNETFGVPARLDGILKSLKDATYTPVFPKRNYVFTEEAPTIIETNPKIIPIQMPNQVAADGNGNGIEMLPDEPAVAAADGKKDLKVVKFEKT